MIITAPRMNAFLANAGSWKAQFCGLSAGPAVQSTIWNLAEICGRITCQASATAGIVTICAHR